MTWTHAALVKPGDVVSDGKIVTTVTADPEFHDDGHVTVKGHPGDRRYMANRRLKVLGKQQSLA